MTTTLLDSDNVTADAVLAGVAEVHGVLDRLHEGSAQAVRPGVAVGRYSRFANGFRRGRSGHRHRAILTRLAEATQSAA